MKPCITCHGKPTKNGHYKAHLHPFVKENLPDNNHPYHDKTGSKFILENLVPNRSIFYFAAMPRDFTLPIQMRDKAYGNIKNRGITKSDSNGKAIVYLHCPQVYQNENGKVYHRHFHFLYYNELKKTWDTNLFTQPIVCEIKESEIKKYPNALLVDARPRDYYEKKHLPNALSLPIDRPITSRSVMKMIQKSMPDEKDPWVPMLLYCQKNCTASKMLAEKLNKLGFYNIIEVKMERILKE